MLLESIKQNGLLHPIIVWEMDKEDVDGHTFEILAGNNRFDMYQYLHKSLRFAGFDPLRKKRL